MKTKIAITVILLLLGWASRQAYGQISASSLMEYQLGNLPDQKPDNLSTVFTKLDLSYRHNDLTLGVRGEQFQSTDQNRTFRHFAQRYLEYQNGPFKVRVGNFYTTLGRGLILRAFELPNVIFEQRTFRRRYAFFRDLDGLLVEGQWDKFEFTTLWGEPLNNEFPPLVLNQGRRNGVIEGGQVVLRPLNWLKLGDGYLRFSPYDRAGMEMNTAFGQLMLGRMLENFGMQRTTLNLYAEHARINSGLNDFFSHAFAEPHATFFALSFSGPKFGFTAELKEYRDFETGINLPPIGFKEHSYYLLNRSTHELLADNEKGYQLEFSARPIDNLFFVAHRSEAKNDYSFGGFEFADNFIETTIGWNNAVTSKFFFDKAKDEIKSVQDQITAGTELEWSFANTYGVTLEYQTQRVKRDYGFGAGEKFTNTYTTVSLSKSPIASLALVLERSDDPAETDDPGTEALEKEPKNWLSVVISYDLKMMHQLSLFAGSRRGGLACVSGSCFEVLPFEGVELRWLARF